MTLIDNDNWGVWLLDNPSVLKICWRGLTLHLGIFNKKHFVWGYEEDWYDGPLPSLGLGPVGMFCWIHSLRDSTIDWLF